MSLESSSTSTIDDSSPTFASPEVKTTAATKTTTTTRALGDSLLLRQQQQQQQQQRAAAALLLLKKNPLDRQDQDQDYYADLIRKPSRSKSVFKQLNMYEKMNLLKLNSIDNNRERRISDTEKIKKKLYDQMNNYNQLLHRNSLNSVLNEQQRQHHKSGISTTDQSSNGNLKSARPPLRSSSLRQRGVLKSAPSSKLHHQSQNSNHNSNNHVTYLVDDGGSFHRNRKVDSGYFLSDFIPEEIETDYVIDDYDETAFENENAASTHRSKTTPSVSSSSSSRMFDTSIKFRKFYMRDLDRRTKEFIEKLDKFQFGSSNDSQAEASDVVGENKVPTNNHQQLIIESYNSSSFIVNNNNNNNSQRRPIKSAIAGTVAATNRPQTAAATAKTVTITTSATAPTAAAAASSAPILTRRRNNQYHYAKRQSLTSAVEKLLNPSTTSLPPKSATIMSTRKKTLHDLYAISPEVMSANNLSTELGEILPRKSNPNGLKYKQRSATAAAYKRTINFDQNVTQID